MLMVVLVAGGGSNRASLGVKMKLEWLGVAFEGAAFVEGLRLALCAVSCRLRRFP